MRVLQREASKDEWERGDADPGRVPYYYCLESTDRVVLTTEF